MPPRKIGSLVVAFGIGSALGACGGAKPEPKLDELPQQKMDLSAAPISAGNTGVSGDLQPVLVTPTVNESEIHDSADMFVAADGTPMISEIDRRISPAQAHDGFAEDLKRALGPGQSSFSVAPFDDVSKGVFAMRSGGKSAGMVVSKKGPFVVPSVEWMRAVLFFRDVDDATAHQFYVAMSTRLATAGRASGIALFTNGNALGIVIEEQKLTDNDTSLVVRSQFFKAGAFDPSAWGPSVRTAQGVSSKDGDGHKGISARDLLKRALGSRAPAPVSGGGLSI